MDGSLNSFIAWSFLDSVLHKISLNFSVAYLIVAWIPVYHEMPLLISTAVTLGESIISSLPMQMVSWF